MVGATGLAPTAEGSLNWTPFVHLLVYMADRGLTGTLVFAGAVGGLPADNVIYFRDGLPAKVRTGEAVAHLGAMLIEKGLLLAPALDAALAAIERSSDLLGEHLILSGAVDRAALAATLREQAMRKIAHLFKLPSTTLFAFYQNANLLEDWGGAEVTPLDSLQLIWSAVHAGTAENLIEPTLARIGETPLKLHQESEVSRFGFGARELAIIDAIRRGPLALSALQTSGIAPKEIVSRVVYTLLITRHLDHGADGAAPVGRQRAVNPYLAAKLTPPTGVPVARVKLKTRRADADPPSEPGRAVAPATSVAPRPPVLDATLAARRDAIQARAAIIDREDYFAMLGVPREAEIARSRQRILRSRKSGTPTGCLPNFPACATRHPKSSRA